MIVIFCLQLFNSSSNVGNMYLFNLKGKGSISKIEIKVFGF